MYKRFQQAGVPQQDEHPYSGAHSAYSDLESVRLPGSSVGSGLLAAHGTSLKVLHLASPNQVSMQLVDVKGSRLTRSKLSQYVISEGKVTGFDIHPSNDYLLVTSSKGRVYVFRIDTGELRGTIKVPLNPAGCVVDPSGLYVVIKVPAYANQNTYNLLQDGGLASQDRLGHFSSNQKDFERNTVLMYEIGTGLPAAEISSIFEITQLKFSDDGRYLALGSSNGTTCVWSMGNHLYQNVKQVIDAMKLSGDFWFNYPIFLPDYEQFNQPADDPMFPSSQPLLPQDIAAATQVFAPQHLPQTEEAYQLQFSPAANQALQPALQEVGGGLAAGPGNDYYAEQNYPGSSQYGPRSIDGYQPTTTAQQP